MNEHKFYNEYIKPVLEEVKEEFSKRGVESRIDGYQLYGENEQSIFAYIFSEGRYSVYRPYIRFFSNEFDKYGQATELIFAPIKPKSIYDLEVGDEFYYITYVECKAKVRRFLIKGNEAYDFYKERVKHGEAFLTEVECERALAKKEAVALIKKRARELQGDWRPDWDNIEETRAYIYYDYRTKQLVIATGYWLRCTDIPFKTEEIAHKIINELPIACKLMLEVYDD